MDNELALALSGLGVLSMEDLAEQSIDELMELEGLTEEKAGELIMTARAPWFADEEEEASESDEGQDGEEVEASE